MSANPSTSTVSVLSKHSVIGSNAGTSHLAESSYLLGPLDSLVAAFIPIPIVLVYAVPAGIRDITQDFLSLEVLRSAMARLLDYYPHLTGRLCEDAETGRRCIQHLGKGAELLEATCSRSLASFSDDSRGAPRPLSLADLPGHANDLLAPLPEAVQEMYSGTLLSIQHTRFACGSVTLGVRVPHTVADAEGCFQIIRHFAELYRAIKRGDERPDLPQSPGVPQMPLAPAHEWTGKEDKGNESYKPEWYHVEKDGDLAAESELSDLASAVTSPLESSSPPVIGRFLHISGAELGCLKAAATDPASKRWVSTFDALTAHLCQRIYLARQKSAETGTSPKPDKPNLLTPVNIRPHLSRSREHLVESSGNALMTVFTSFSPDFLASAPLREIALRVHDITHSKGVSSKEEVLQTLRWMTGQPSYAAIRQSFDYGPGSLMISAWNKMDVYGGTAFEVQPALVASPFTAISLMDGLGYYLPLPPAKHDDGILLCLALSGPVWTFLDADPEFRRHAKA